VGSLLPHAGDAKLPIDEFAEISRWYAQLEQIPAWREPFPRQEANAA
jgi:glutathione S-transferase